MNNEEIVQRLKELEGLLKNESHARVLMNNKIKNLEGKIQNLIQAKKRQAAGAKAKKYKVG